MGPRPAVIQRVPARRMLREVPFKNLRKRLTTTVDELDKARLQHRYEGLDIVSIGKAPLREPVRLGGEVQAIHVVPRAGSPSLEVEVSDGTGKVVAVFTGRRRIAGISCGRGVLIEGVARSEARRLVVLNPHYTLLP